MKLHFAMSFDDRVHDPQRPSTLLRNEKFVGPLGLLNFLELELGLTRPEIPHIRRVNAMRECLEIHLKPGDFAYESFQKNRLKTAEELLFLRDELISLGWTPDLPGQPRRFRALAQIESEASAHIPAGVAQRLLSVLAELPACERKHDLILHHAHDLFHPSWQRLITRLTEHGWSVSEAECPTSAQPDSNLQKLCSFLNTDSEKPPTFNTDDDSLTILHSGSEFHTLPHILHLLQDSGNILFAPSMGIAADTMLQNVSASPLGSAVYESRPRHLLLPLLALQLLRPQPALRSLYQLTLLPYTLFRAESARFIRSCISRQHNLDFPAWLKALDQQDHPWSDSKKQLIREDLLQCLINPEWERSEDVFSPAQISRLLDLLLQKLPDPKDSEEDRARHVRELRSLIKEFRRYIQNRLEALSLTELETALSSLISPGHQSYLKAETLSARLLEHPANLLGKAPLSIYWDFNGAFSINEHEKFYPSEIEWLRKNKDSCNLLPFSGAAHRARLWKSALLKSLQLSSRVLILLFDKDKDEGSPILDALSLKNSNGRHLIFRIPEPTLPEETSLFTDLHPALYWSVSHPERLQRRRQESYSSLSTLIEYPHAYALQHFAGIRRDSSPSFSVDSSLKGRVAHKCIELLSDSGLLLSSADCLPHIPSRFTEAVRLAGSLLNEDEFRTERKELLTTLQNSIPRLQQILRNTGIRNLRIEMEKHIENIPFADTLLNGKIDMILYAGDEPKAVIDLKYSGGNYRIPQLSDNRAYQLSVYTSLLNKPDLPVAYYIIKSGLLLVSDSTLFRIKDRSFRGIDNRLNMEELQESYLRRIEEFRSGRIEVGIDSPLSTLDFWSAEFRRWRTDSSWEPLKPISRYEDFPEFIARGNTL